MHSASNRWLGSLLLLCLGSSAWAQQPGPAVEDLLQAEDARDANQPSLQAGLTAADAKLRARTATAWGRIMKPEGVDPLLKLLADPDASVQQEAVFALGQLGWVAGAAGDREKEIAGKLVPLLKSQDEKMRLLVVEAIGKLAGDQTPTLLREALADTSAAVRAEAAMGMFRWRLVARLRAGAGQDVKVPDLEAPAFDDLIRAAKDSDALVRRNVAYYFARTKDARGLQTLIPLTQDADVDVRVYAATGIGRTEDPNGAEALVQVTKDQDEKVRLAALQALLTLKKGGLAPAALAKDPSHHVRAALADAIGADETADPAVLAELWKDSSQEVRAAALKAQVTRKQVPILDRLGEALSDPSPILREAAIESAAGLGAEAEGFLRRGTADSSELVRASALGVLGAIEGPAGWQAIQAALSADGIAERGTAVDLLKGRKEAEVVATAAATYRASQDPKWVEVREMLVDLAAAQTGDAAEALLKEALKDAAPSVSSKARDALAAKGSKDLPPAAAAAPASNTPHKSLRFQADPVVVVETNRGSFKIRCFPADAPLHVANFVGLVRAGFYDGLLWHRVVPNFVVQGGDPMGTGWGDAGWTVRAEINRQRFLRGALGMPRSQGFDTGSCQLFFSLVPTPHLDGQYTVFGQIVEGLEVLDRLERGDRIVKASLAP